MLVLGRKVAQTIQIGDDIQVTILKVQDSRVRIGIKAPADVRVLRGELESCQREWATDISCDSEQSGDAIASCK
ncbi:MAG: carbon storage regulator [Bythopirellula sp.]